MEEFRINGDLRINRVGYGAMRLCGVYNDGWCEDRTAPSRVLKRAVELGVNFIDTSDSYGPHINEEQIADALFPYPPDLVIGTKGSTIRTRGEPKRRDYDNRPEYLRSAVEGSLRRLKLDRIALYQIHRLDGITPLADSMGALAELQEEGKISYVGLSEVDVPTLEIASKHVRIATVQNQFNLWDRRHGAVLAWCEANGVGFIPWFPLGGGMKPVSSDETVIAVAAECGASANQIALAWLLARSPNTILIPGTASVSHLEENVAASTIHLTNEQMRRLDAVA